MGGQIKNRNGNMDLLEFIRLLHNGKLDDYMRRFSTIKSQCPPVELIDKDQQCFYCSNCQSNCASKVKEYKKYYKVGKQQFMKEDLEEKE